jgi:hypothetical protein
MIRAVVPAEMRVGTLKISADGRFGGQLFNKLIFVRKRLSFL